MLTYHIAKKYINQNKKVALIHCANLNCGHNKLNADFKWNIVPIKYWETVFKDKVPDIVIIDEIQRINRYQFLDMLNNYINPNNLILIMSGDGKQILQDGEGQVFNEFEETNYNNLKKIPFK